MLPGGFIFAYLLASHNPACLDQKSWQTILASMTSCTTWWALTGVMRNLRNATLNNSLEVKIFNEQVKLMATSLNALALAILVFGIAQPVINQQPFQIWNGVLLLIGIFVHTRSYLILACMKADC